MGEGASARGKRLERGEVQEMMVRFHQVLKLKVNYRRSKVLEPNELHAPKAFLAELETECWNSGHRDVFFPINVNRMTRVLGLDIVEEPDHVNPWVTFAAKEKTERGKKYGPYLGTSWFDVVDMLIERKDKIDELRALLHSAEELLQGHGYDGCDSCLDLGRKIQRELEGKNHEAN